MSDLIIPTAEVFEPLLAPSRYKGAHGGRGSGKSHFFAGLMVERAFAEQGFRGVCIREVQKSLKQSAKLLIEDKIQAFGLGAHFDPQAAQVVTPGGGVIAFQGMQDHTAESVKSLEGFDVAWIEEAQSLSQRSLTLLRPTIRKDGSEIWASWNPTRKTDPVDVLLRGASKPTGAVVVRANWSDNPWLPGVLSDERKDDLKARPDQYDHIWEGGYATVTEGAYYARQLAEAKAEGRITVVPRDKLMAIHAIWDIGGTGRSSDACSIWIAQFIGQKINVIDYYEAVGQELAEHVSWMRSKGYERAKCVLPHDGVQHDKVYRVSYESALREAGFAVQIVPSPRGAVTMRIDATRRLFPKVWFNAATTEVGREALGFYHEKKDEKRNAGLGPDHDWSSHGADAFGLMCMAYEEPRKNVERLIIPAFGAV